MKKDERETRKCGSYVAFYVQVDGIFSDEKSISKKTKRETATKNNQPTSTSSTSNKIITASNLFFFLPICLLFFIIHYETDCINITFNSSILQFWIYQSND